jgi:hypothetical protein
LQRGQLPLKEQLMNDRFVDAMTRRASFAGLSAAGLASLLPPAARGKSKRKGNDDKAKKKCKTQVGQCTDLVAIRCSVDPNTCTEALECCEFAGRCDFTGLINCLIVVQT